MSTPRILLPFNFTDACVTALRYAYQFAAHLNADITLLHCTGDLQLTPTFESRLLLRLRSFSQRHASAFSKGLGTEPFIDCVIKSGHLREQLAQAVEEFQIDMLVSPAGYLLAGLAQEEVVALPDLVARPILLIPPKAQFTPLREIVFTLDVTDTDPLVLERVQKLSRTFNAHLTLLHLHSQLDGVSFCQVQKAATALQSQLEYSNKAIICQEEDDLVEGLNSLAGSMTPDLFVLATQDTHLLQEYFSGEFKKTNPCHLHTPLLNLYQARRTACSASCRHCNQTVSNAEATEQNAVIS
ncbi:universal stress protein [Nibribacter ruber]|uniref:Universal stress protein n=1 Tax=Nibribacter ruber TaxID=2698458 RepID=A0A6P1P4D1_9BACT|nr:universal stress protein [Nibribacter ruber]QHL89188.1 universal stress protein [Nibribacter ruber]